MLKYVCRNDNIKTKSSTCPVCGERTELEKSDIYWCDNCKVPLFQSECECCSGKGTRITTDIRPVFPEERLLLEILLDKIPGTYEKDSVWNCSGNKYLINGKRIKFSVKELKNKDVDDIRSKYEEASKNISYEYFEQYADKFVQANRSRYEFIVREAVDYIKNSTKDYTAKDMFVSFSGGKDSTVTSDIVMRALSEPKILHIFGDTTLEFPETMRYVDRFKKEHPQTPVLSSRNKDKDFEELCKLVGPPSRVMRWCCTIFKTGAIQRKIKTLFRNKNKIITFYGIRRSESASRSKYERETEGSKITKQITISPIIDWMDFDVWLYMLTTKIDFNYAYRLGYARVGCWCCPNNSGWSEFLSKIHMPQQSERFRQMLIDFAKQIGKPDPEVYVDDGKWKARQGGNGVDYAKKTAVSFEPCALEENAFNYELQRPISEQLYELFKPFGYLNFEFGNKRLGEVYVTRKDGRLVLKLQGRIGSTTLKVTIIDYKIDGAASVKAAEDKVKCQITKYQMCMGCRACESICKHNAIVIKEDKEGNLDYKILDDKCVRCAECVNHYTAGCYMRKVLATKKG
ncbi:MULTISPECIES: phosphoadenosine phosphosulfate reductase family protein [Eubacterium]|uniref:Phosphoadenosine phosphosulfate reductase family protein n=2 Tax=Eubacterium TaxID=1730 RepID=A0ABT2M2I9_9FIRM|nr:MULTISPECIES: phosphoadenosine phosphosulfate reductase family protein [unclassified Eubacterium (in: firmicutes)]MCT7399748.1 phosphoadenosine phosphosulfate reductase family protein [Eubacterium sp. LFL-14]